MLRSSIERPDCAVRDMAREFAAEKIAPHALRWDEEKHFPVDVMREAATLGMGGIYIKDDVGGSAMTRFDAALIFEALATGLSDRVGLHLDPQHGVVDDRCLRQRHPAPEMAAKALHHGAVWRAIA